MPKKAAGLTARTVQTEKRPGLYGDGGGLYLQVAETGAKTWIYRFQIRGRRRDMGLGSAAIFSLAEVRERARAARRKVADGEDPIEARRNERAGAALEAAKATTFQQAAEAYIAANRAGWKSPKSLTAWEHTLSAFAYPAIGALPVASIDVALTMKVLSPIWTTTPETASRLRGRIEAVLDYAKVIGQRSGENPARWRGHLDHLLPARQKVAKTQHHAALPYVDIGAFVAELQRQEGMGARALEFAILTAARTGEVISARWDEINLAERLWIVPGTRMKAGKEHRVPLSEPALAILRAMAAIRQGEYVFAGGAPGRPLSNMSLLMALRRMKRGDLTAHGFRSSFSDWCAEQTNFPSEVREMALAHAVGDKVEAAYRRGNLLGKRRELAAAWGSFCSGESP